VIHIAEGRVMAETTSDVLVERLIDWGVDTVFGIPGDRRAARNLSSGTIPDSLRLVSQPIVCGWWHEL
jgi:hypothetical protein